MFKYLKRFFNGDPLSMSPEEYKPYAEDLRTLTLLSMEGRLGIIYDKVAALKEVYDDLQRLSEPEDHRQKVLKSVALSAAYLTWVEAQNEWQTLLQECRKNKIFIVQEDGIFKLEYRIPYSQETLL